MIIVTGGCGFIGYWTIRMLLEEGYRVKVVDNLSRAGMLGETRKLGVEILRVDVRNYNGLVEAFKGASKVIHLAALISVEESKSKPLLYHEVNALGTLNVLRASVEAGVSRVLYASTAAVYGEPESLPIRENHPTKPLSVYGASKLAGEAYCNAFHHAYGVETVVLRYFNVYGPGQSPEYAGVIQRFIRRVKEEKPPIIFGDGSQTRDFIHVTDVARANLRALESSVKHGTFNIATGREISIKKLAILISEISGVNAEPEYRKPRPCDVKRSYADISTAKKILGFKPEVELEEGLRKMLHNRALYP